MAAPARHLDHDLDYRVELFDPAEMRLAFDAEARRSIGMSGDEFIRRWDAGEFPANADDGERPEIMRMALLISFGR